MPIEPRQAGEEIVCRCGAKLQAPTMLEIRALEPAAVPPAETAASSWGWRHQLRLLGALALLAGIFAGGWFYYTRPISDSDKMPPEVLQRSAHNLTPVQTWSEWQSAKQGLDSRVDQKYLDKRTKYHIWLTISGVFVLAGIGLIAVGTLRPRS